MALSRIEKLLVNQAKNGLREGKVNSINIRVLSYEAFLELVNDVAPKYLYRLMQCLSNDKAGKLFCDIYEGKVSIPSLDKENSLYILCSSRSKSFYTSLLNHSYDAFCYAYFFTGIFKHDYDFNFTKEQASSIISSFIHIRENIYLSSNSLDFCKSVLSRLFNLVDDKEKYEFLKGISYCFNDDFNTDLLKTIKDRDIYIDSLGYLLGSSLDLNLEDISSTDIYEGILSYLSSLTEINIKNHGARFYFFNYLDSLSHKQILDIVDECLKKGISSYELHIFVTNIITKDLESGGLNSLNDIYDVFAKNGKEKEFWFTDEKKIMSILIDFSSSQLMELYDKCSIPMIKSMIRGNSELWMNEPMFSYFVKNESQFILDFISRLYGYEVVEEKVKQVLVDSDIAIQFISNLGGRFGSYDALKFNLKDLFFDDNFCFRLIKENPECVISCLNINPKIDFLVEAFKYADVSQVTYYFCKDKPDFYKVWFEKFEEKVKSNNSFDNLADLLNYFGINGEDDKILEILSSKGAELVNLTYEEFMNKFNSLKVINGDILKSFDYRLFDKKFSFLEMSKLEMIAAHKNITRKLCNLTAPQLKIVKRIMTYSFDFDLNWIDLLDRVLIYIDSNDALTLDLYDKEIDNSLMNNLIKIYIQDNHLGIQSYSDLVNYDNILSNELEYLVNADSVYHLKKAIALKLFGINLDELNRIYKVYCTDLDNFIKVSNNSSLKEILTLVKKISECNSVAELKNYLNNTQLVNTSPCYLINLDSEIRKEFTRLYNDTLYHVDENNLLKTVYYKEMTQEDDNVLYAPASDGIAVNLYDPSMLINGGEFNYFSLVMTSLGAYSEQKSAPDDYYANWNVDKIESHGFCCSYLTPDNLGTARICHACLGFTDFDLDALLLSAPYDIGSSSANRQFNTTRGIDTCFCTPRGMADDTRHTHNEMVFERRNIHRKAGDDFKKAPSYVVFFCEDFSNLSIEEERIYSSSVKAAIQLGKGKPLPLLVIDRGKIAAYQRSNIDKLYNGIINSYSKGDIGKFICLFLNNSIGNTYAENVRENYFSMNILKGMLSNIRSNILNLLSNGEIELALEMFNDYECSVNNESSKPRYDGTFDKGFYDLDNFKMKFNLLLESRNKSKLSSDMVSAIFGILDDSCKRRLNRVDMKGENLVDKNVFNDILSNLDFRGVLFKKMDELDKMNIYVANTPYDNRHVANMLLYASLMYKGNDSKVFSALLDAISYQDCSYMDGKDEKNEVSAYNKARRLMDEANYSGDRDLVCLLILLKDKRDINLEMIDKIRNEYNLSCHFTAIELQDLVNIMHDAASLEHTRFITAGNLDKGYFYDRNHFQLAAIAYELGESYANLDLQRYLNEHPEMEDTVKVELESKLPQEVIRNIRKGRIVINEQKKSSAFDDVFLSIDETELTDPLGLLDRKMSNYGSLPKQVSIIEFYKYISESPYYSYMIDKIDHKKNLYLKLSAIHGETHANNVTLFATYIASKLGLKEDDIKTIIEAAIYHDIGRESDTNDYRHGELGALKYSTNVEVPERMSSRDVKFLIEAHALKKFNDLETLFEKYNISEGERERLRVMASVIRDADALDRTRFRLLEESNNLNPDYLVNECSKSIISACQQLNYVIYHDYVLSNRSNNLAM